MSVHTHTGMDNNWNPFMEHPSRWMLLCESIIKIQCRKSFWFHSIWRVFPHPLITQIRHGTPLPTSTRGYQDSRVKYRYVPKYLFTRLFIPFNRHSFYLSVPSSLSMAKQGSEDEWHPCYHRCRISNLPRWNPEQCCLPVAVISSCIPCVSVCVSVHRFRFKSLIRYPTKQTNDYNGWWGIIEIWFGTRWSRCCWLWPSFPIQPSSAW